MELGLSKHRATRQAWGQATVRSKVAGVASSCGVESVPSPGSDIRTAARAGHEGVQLRHRLEGPAQRDQLALEAPQPLEEPHVPLATGGEDRVVAVDTTVSTAA